MTAKPKIFETAFCEGTKVKVGADSIGFYTVDIGKINIESGKIIACDPIVMQDAIPFIQTFPIGKFSIQLSIAKIKNYEQVAFSRIYFSDKPVVRWEFAAHTPEQKQVPIDGKTLIGYGVDGGTGLFIDEKANKDFEERSKKDEELWIKVFIDDMEDSANGWKFIFYHFDNHSLASFSTGDGDGHYGTYVGYDENGMPCRLLTDFALVTWWKK